MEQRSKDEVELLVEVLVILGRAWNGEELPFDVGKQFALGLGKLRTEPVPQIVDALFEDGAVEEMQYREGEEKGSGFISVGIGRLWMLREPENPSVAAHEDLDQRLAGAIDEASLELVEIALERALVDVEVSQDAFEAPSEGSAEQFVNDLRHSKSSTVGGAPTLVSLGLFSARHGTFSPYRQKPILPPACLAQRPEISIAIACSKSAIATDSPGARTSAIRAALKTAFLISPPVMSGRARRSKSMSAASGSFSGMRLRQICARIRRVGRSN